MYPLRRNRDAAPSLHCCSLAVSPLSLHPLPSLMSNCSNLPFRTRGRSWRLESVPYRQGTGVTKRLLYPGTYRAPGQWRNRLSLAPYELPEALPPFTTNSSSRVTMNLISYTTVYFGLTCVLSIKNCLKWILAVQSWKEKYLSSWSA